MSLQGYPVVIQESVLWGEMDAFQHVNNTVYFRYFESDFLDYCYTLTTYDYPLEQAGSTYRSRLAGFSSYFLQDLFGTIDAIAVSSLVWTALCFSFLYFYIL